MQEAIKQMLRLQEASGAIRKMQILRECQGNEDFRKLLYYALNPRLTYKVSEATLAQRCVYNPAITLVFTSIFEVCEALSQRKALDDETVYQVIAFLETQDEECRELFKKLLSKTLRLGVTAKSVNKVIHGLIPEWEVQQAYPIEKYPPDFGAEFWLTEKLNGVRATLYKGKLYARSGVPFEGLEHITDEFCWDVDFGMVYDGELTLENKGNLSDNEAFRVATGIINSENADKMAICYTIFDCLPATEFERGESKAPYSIRRRSLESFARTLSDDSPVRVLPILYHGEDQTKVDEYLEQMVCADKEGLMLNLDVPYKCKRHNGILKVKRFYTMDLRIVGFEEGSGRLAGILGALVVEYKGNTVRVGSGFTDEQRIHFWDQREELLGTLCEVKYKEISSDKNTGAESLQFPVFVTLRTDKDEESFS